MKLNIVFATTTALGLLMAAGAWAGQNDAYLLQNGNSNSQLVNQSGSNNNKAGGPLTADKLTQNGDNNSLHAQQSAGSTLGISGWAAPYYQSPAYAPASLALGVDQNGDFNVINTTQTSGQIVQIQQNAPHGPAINGATNSATVNQTTDFSGGAVVGSILQTYTGVHGGSSDDNELSITQTAHAGDPGFAHRVLVQSSYQNGTNNHLTVNQNLSNQTIVELTQAGAGNQGTVNQGGTAGSGNFLAALRQVGSTNSGVVNMYGNNNGGNSLNSNSPGGASGWNFASNSGAYASSVVQLGTSNSATLTITGDSNQFGILQDGIGNSVGGVTIDGDSNSVGLYQHDNGNVISLAAVSGDYNDIGLRQDGPSNTINATSTGSDGRIWVKQQGGYNDATVKQGGYWNVIEANVVGNSNHLNIQQNILHGTGSYNTATVTITGSNNNNAGGFIGNAASANIGHGLNPGDLFQDTGSNHLTFTVANSDSNLFATSQWGTSNTITATVSSGNGNQAVVTQNGDNNSSNVTQTGSFNNVGINQ